MNVIEEIERLNPGLAEAMRVYRERRAAAFVRRRTLKVPRWWTNPIPRTGRGVLPNRRPA